MVVAKTRSSSDVVVAAAVAGCVALYALQAWVTRATFGTAPDRMHAALMLLAGIAQSIVLYALAKRFATATQTATVCAVLGVAAMFALSVAFAADNDIDAASYVGYAKLPAFHDAYRPPIAEYHDHGFQIINTTRGPRLVGLVYGPLWLAVDRVVASFEPTYALALLALRLQNIVLLGVLFEALCRLRVSRTVLVLVAVNPAIWFYYVVQAHNDLMAIVLVVAGMVIAEKRPLLGALVAGAAGLVKISFVLIAGVAMAGKHGVRTSVVIYAAAIAPVVALSALFGGREYLDAMLSMGHDQIANHMDRIHAVGIVLHLTLVAIAVAATLWAISRNRSLSSASFSYAVTSTIVYPWYVVWALPYALRVPAFTAPFLISMPAIMHLIDPHFSIFVEHSFAVLYFAFAASIVWIVVQFARPGTRQAGIT